MSGHPREAGAGTSRLCECVNTEFVWKFKKIVKLALSTLTRVSELQL